MASLKKDHFLLGVFGPNCSSGMSVTKIPERWNNSWENNLKLAHMLEDAGVEFMLPVVSLFVHRDRDSTNTQGRDI